MTGDNNIEDVVYLFDKSCVYREAKHVDIPADERNAIRNYRVENQKLKVKALEDELYELRKKLSVMKQEMYDAMDAKKSDTDDDTNKNDSQNNSKNNSKNKPNRQHNQTPFVYITDGSNIRKRIKEIEEIMPMERDNLYFMSFGMVQRHPAIPAHINNKDVWYDTYYDRERDVYFRGIDDDTFNNATKKLRKELKMPYGCGWTPYASKDISFVHGVPAVRSMISSVNACAKEHTYRSLPSLGVENAHWRMFIFKHSIINRDYYSQIDLNSQGYNNIDKIYSLLLLRLGQTQKRYGGTYNSPTDRELVEEDIHLAKEGNKNFNSLVCNDTEYSDGEHISQAATPQMQWKDSWYPVYILKD